MIRRWLDALADRFTDTDWLQERRRQEEAAIQETIITTQATRRARLEPPFEGDFFPQAPKRKIGGQKL